MNYKSGDLVKITGKCNYHHFTFGETVRLKENDGSDWLSESLEGRQRWWVCECDMAPVKPAIMPQKIIVTTDGKITLARLFDGKTMVKRAEAKCAPSDVFDFNTGAELAVKRLIGDKKADAAITATEHAKESEPVKLYCFNDSLPHFTQGRAYEFKHGRIKMDNRESFRYASVDDFLSHNISFKSCLVPLVRRPAKVGEWIYPLEDCPFGRYKKGELLKCTIDDKNVTDVWRRKAVEYNNSCCVIKHDEYLVLGGYTGDPA